MDFFSSPVWLLDSSTENIDENLDKQQLQVILKNGSQTKQR